MSKAVERLESFLSFDAFFFKKNNECVSAGQALGLHTSPHEIFMS